MTKEETEAELRGVQADLSLAKQLQASMELNARMKNRLLKHVNLIAVGGENARQAIYAILKDQEPFILKEPS
jgi:hypothetical protein